MIVKTGEVCDPQIIHQMVYQSVEAPQVEPLHKQEFQPNPYQPVFKSYDLVKNKAAGLLVKIQYPDYCPINHYREFNLKLSVNRELLETSCLSFEETKSRGLQFKASYPSEGNCFFSSYDFVNEGTLLKFVDLSLDFLNGNRYHIPVKIDIFEYHNRIENTVKVSYDDNNGEVSSCAYSRRHSRFKSC